MVITEVHDGYMLGRTPHFEAMWPADGSHATFQETSKFDARRGARATTA